MSAERLREAAKVLRGFTEHPAMPAAPWTSCPGAYGLPSDGPDHMRVISGKSPANAIDAIARFDYTEEGGLLADYVATMHPDVAATLANWLKHVAQYDQFNGWANKIADSILGGSE